MNRRNTTVIASVAAAIVALGAGTYWLAAGSPEPPARPPQDSVAVRPPVPDKPPSDKVTRPERPKKEKRVALPEDRGRKIPKDKQKPGKHSKKKRRDDKPVEKKRYVDGC